jgi:hypothetical protein
MERSAMKLTRTMPVLLACIACGQAAAPAADLEEMKARPDFPGTKGYARVAVNGTPVSII